jgi:transcriptional regulator with XRE-family HTH domain
MPRLVYTPEQILDMKTRLQGGQKSGYIAEVTGINLNTVNYYRLQLGIVKGSLTQTEIDEVRRMRAEERRSAQYIAKTLNITKSKILKHIQDLPLVTRTNPLTGWLPDELTVLQSYYPTESREKILKALPRRNWKAVSDKASTLGIKRVPIDINEHRVPDIFTQLYQRRKELGLTYHELGGRSGIYHHQIRNWELGINSPKLDNFIKWAAALGYRFELVDTTTPVEVSAKIKKEPTPIDVVYLAENGALGYAIGSTPLTYGGETALAGLGPVASEPEPSPDTPTSPVPGSADYDSLSPIERYVSLNWSRMTPEAMGLVWEVSKRRILEIGKYLNLGPEFRVIPHAPKKMKTPKPPKPPKVSKPVVEVVAPIPVRPKGFLTPSNKKVSTGGPTEEEIQKFIAEKGINRVPGVGDPEIRNLPPLVHNPATRKQTRGPTSEKRSWGFR